MINNGMVLCSLSPTVLGGLSTTSLVPNTHILKLFVGYQKEMGLLTSLLENKERETGIKFPSFHSHSLKVLKSAVSPKYS